MTNHTHQHRHNGGPVLRRSWVTAVVAACQHLAGQANVVELDEIDVMLADFTRRLPAPHSQIERVVMRSLLLDVACRCATTLHARVHHANPDSCPFSVMTGIDGFCRTPIHKAPLGFRRWAESFTAEFKRVHPPTLAMRVGRVIREEYQRPWTLAQLARRFHVTPGQLRSAFQRQFGMSIRQYQEAMRVSAALQSVSSGKVEAAALEVGYRSKSSFYRALRQSTGLTPTAFRRLPGPRAAEIVARIDVSGHKHHSIH